MPLVQVSVYVQITETVGKYIQGFESECASVIAN